MKIRHVREYLNSTRDMCLTLRADKSKYPMFSIDADKPVHASCKGHTGGSITMGKGSVFTLSYKQNINATSSTNIELVSVYDCMLHVLWLRHLLLAQGYERADIIDSCKIIRVQLCWNITVS